MLSCLVLLVGFYGGDFPSVVSHLLDNLPHAS